MGTGKEPLRWEGPSPETCREVCLALVQLHWGGQPRSAAPDGCDLGPCSVLDSLVRTILSQNTTDITSARAFRTLKQELPTWEEVRTAPTDKVADSIRVGGLALIKAQRIQAILNTLHAERGSCCLEHLRQLPEEDIKQQLLRFKGVGAKTIACLLMFCLNRPEFPVDTHVWEISKQLGWVPPSATRDATYEHLNKRVPDEIKHDLHVLMVEHGKKCPACAKQPAAGGKRKRADRDQSPPCPLQPFKKKSSKAGSSRSSSEGGSRSDTPQKRQLLASGTGEERDV